MKRIFGILLLMFATASFADTETINWYVDGNVYNTTTCQTGGDITLQTAPAKRGHTFTGWQVASYDFSTLDASISGTDFTRNEAKRIWKVVFPYGAVSGKSVCSVTSATYEQIGVPDESTGGGQNCWCKATGYISNDSYIVHENSVSSVWVFASDFASNTSSVCASDCARFCAIYTYSYNDFRRPLFGITQ